MSRPNSLGTNFQLDNVIRLLGQVELAGDEEGTDARFLRQSSSKMQGVFNPRSIRREAEAAWKLGLKSELSIPQRKLVLSLVSTKVIPCFTQSELLMDFLIDSFDAGGSLSLMALSGIFLLIQQKNLDYPQFYRRVYSLLDSNCLHTKHRAHLLRLIDTFMASTHLPAVLVASFAKRLSTLCLHSNALGIIAVVPWIYNILKGHPACTVMVHKPIQQGKNAVGKGSPGDDPFSPNEPEPMMTKAIFSSLWEIETLQAHFDPQVSTIAKILSQQFTKPVYKLEDFNKHNYSEVSLQRLSEPGG